MFPALPRMQAPAGWVGAAGSGSGGAAPPLLLPQLAALKLQRGAGDGKETSSVISGFLHPALVSPDS